MKLNIVRLCAVAFILMAGAAGAQSGQSNWEYKIVTEGAGVAPQRQLNELGAAGWELVSVVCRQKEGGATSLCYYYLKRRK